MADFSHLKKLNVSTTTVVEYPLYQLEGEPVLHLVAAGESNKQFFNALLRKGGKKAQRVQKQGVNAGIIKENREEDKELYAKYIVKGWTGILDANGNDVPFSSENVRDFLNQLPDWMFDEIRVFATNVQNFIEQVNVEDKAKN